MRKRKRFSELPDDKDEMSETVGPPPAWFTTQTATFNPQQFWPWGYGLAGLGDQEKEVEVNPVEYIQDLKFNQEMSKKIPAIASRYTNIDPLSPMFRENLAKYGFGEIEAKKSILGFIVIAILVWVLLVKK